MNLSELARSLLDAGLKLAEVRHELRRADCGPTCSAVEEALEAALKLGPPVHTCAGQYDTSCEGCTWLRDTPITEEERNKGG